MSSLPFTLTPGQQEMVDYLNLTIAESRRSFSLWYGGVRAGKSDGATIGTLLHSRQRKNATYMIAAFTSGLAVDVFYPKFRRYTEILEMDCKQVKGTKPRMEIDGNEFLLFGGNDMGRDRNIQGLTLAGLVLDEFPNLNFDFIAQAEGRLSDVGAMRIYTANKVSPYHWTTKHYYNRAKKGEIDALLIDSDTKDNPFIDKAFISEKELEYGDKHYRRFIGNEFTLDRPPLYTPEMRLSPNAEYPIAVMVGEGNLIYHLCVSLENGEYVIQDAQEMEIGSDIETGHIGTGSVFLVNAERPMLGRLLRRKGYSVRAFRSDFTPRRVEQTQMVMSMGRLKVNPELDSLTQAVNEYSTPGMYLSPYVKAVEILGEYISRRG